MDVFQLVIRGIEKTTRNDCHIVSRKVFKTSEEAGEFEEEFMRVCTEELQNIHGEQIILDIEEDIDIFTIKLELMEET